ncbi:MAG: MBL fold metallo-hydrolase [Acidobacteriia bacterium]|nr:MBL fold metallo-hydrolase [Terriglobia bacterium]
MEVGFDTVGNATIIAYDRGPVLVTDPWLRGSAYFGSWTFSHQVPDEQMLAASSCPYVWVSHGHPDHLSSESLRLLKIKTLLLPDHVGSRIADDLRNEGYDVQVLHDKRWYKLSDRIRILCLADYNQDGILLIDINGRLVVNFNDSSERGWGQFVRKVIQQFPISFLLRLSGYGDADMINIFNESGERLLPVQAAHRLPVGNEIAVMMRDLRANHFIPFSSMHRYQRSDSVWADEHTTGLEDYAVGFDSRAGILLPAFIRYDCLTDTCQTLNPPEQERRIHRPEEFGDNWSDLLEADELLAVRNYFTGIEHLGDHFDYFNFRIGGRDNIVELGKGKYDRAITFAVPRNSLMTAIRHHIFDDLLIGNFMRTTLHGKFGNAGLYPDFTPYVTKYADNGLARSKEELAEYFRKYMQRAPFEYLRGRVRNAAKDVIRDRFAADSSTYRLARRAYHLIKASPFS